MASTINFSTLTLTTEEATDVSMVVFEQVYSKPEIVGVHAIQTGVEMDRRIPILGQYGLVGKVDPAACNKNAETGQIPTSEKTWTPKLISYRISHCQADVPTLLKFWKKARIAAGTWEEVDNEMMAFISDRVLDANKEAILRIADFADTAAEVVGSGGYLTAGTTKTYFNMLDGMWKQIFTDQAGAALIHRFTIDENAEATKVAQLALATDAALKVLRDLYNNIDPRAFDDPTLTFQVTKSLLNNWQDFLEDKSLAFTLNQIETKEGVSKWSYRGIPIQVRNDWDRMIRTYHDLGATYYLPHRAILTGLNNIPIGTSDEESLTSLDSFYDRTDKVHYIDVAFKLDMKILQEYAMACAY
jgi:hypothetical protein